MTRMFVAVHVGPKPSIREVEVFGATPATVWVREGRRESSVKRNGHLESYHDTRDEALAELKRRATVRLRIVEADLQREQRRNQLIQEMT